MAGAWDELLDRVGELGIATPAASTTRRRAAEFVEPYLARRDDGSVATLARRTDEAVFSGRELDDAEVDAVWAEVIVTVNATRATLPRWKRALSRYRLAAAAGWARRVAALAAAQRGGANRGGRA